MSTCNNNVSDSAIDRFGLNMGTHVVSAAMAAPEMWLDAAEGSGSGGVLPDADWPWPWGPLGLNPWLTLAMALISFASEGLCKLSPALH